jgi:DNA mismatch repair ATPase MutL
LQKFDVAVGNIIVGLPLHTILSSLQNSRSANMESSKSQLVTLSERDSRSVRAAYRIPDVLSLCHELVTNALEAKATSIRLKIDLAKWIVQVTDNGVGMSVSDLQVVPSLNWSARDTTADQLHNRGEALVAITALCEELEILCHDEAAQQTHIKRVSEGCFVSRPSAHKRSYTQVTAKGIFYNTPVRRKQISGVKAVSEVGRLGHYFRCLALLHSHIAFSFVCPYPGDPAEDQAFATHGGRQRSRKNVFISVFGAATGKDLVDFSCSEIYDLSHSKRPRGFFFANHSSNNNNNNNNSSSSSSTSSVRQQGSQSGVQGRVKTHVSGLVSPLDARRLSRNCQMLFVNQRVCTNKKLRNLINGIFLRFDKYIPMPDAVNRTYYPCFVVFITLENTTVQYSARTEGKVQFDPVVLKHLEALVSRVLVERLRKCHPRLVEMLSETDLAFVDQLAGHKTQQPLQRDPLITEFKSQRMQAHKTRRVGAAQTDVHANSRGEDRLQAYFDGQMSNTLQRARATPAAASTTTRQLGCSISSTPAPISELLSQWQTDRFKGQVAQKYVQNRSARPVQKAKITKDMLRRFTVLRQVDDKFIIGHVDGLLIAIDQHAADERVRVECFRKCDIVLSVLLCNDKCQ